MRGYVRKILNTVKQKMKMLLYQLKYCFILYAVNPKKVVFINFNGKGYGCNPKYIAEALRNKNLQLIWLVKGAKTFPEGVKAVEYNSMRMLYELATAKYIVMNTKSEIPLKKKNTQIIIQTWHGSSVIKKVEGEAVDKLPLEYINNSIRNSQMTDYFISNSRYQSYIYRKYFWYKNSILEIGSPRNDILVNIDELRERELKRKLGLSENSKYILYAPTFRDSGDSLCYLKDFHNIIEACNVRFGGDWKIIVKLHPRIGRLLYSSEMGVIDLSSYSDIQEILAVSNALITDYSSILFDFALTKRPIFLYASDIDAYKKNRGIKDEYYQLPFPICTRVFDLVMTIKKFSIQEYEHKINKVNEKYNEFEKGNAVERLVDIIFDSERICL